MIKLKLRIRKRGDTFRLSREVVGVWMRQSEEAAKQLMYNFFLPLKDDEPDVHDYEYLQQIIEWVPTDERSGQRLGLPLKEQVRLIRLTERLLPFIDAEKPEEGEVELFTKDIDLLWERMNDPKYLVGAISPPYAAFLIDFQQEISKWFPEFEEEQKEQAEAEEAKGKDNEREPERVGIPTEG